MIASLRGTLVDKSTDGAVIEAGGVGYAITITASAFRGLPSLGNEARLHIYTHAVQDGGLQLFGFADGDERRLFETLISVQGVGPKLAVAIVSGVPTGELVRAIAGGDVGRLTQIRGVGRKIAERLAVELREKVAALAPSREGFGIARTSLPSIVPSGRLGEVHGALVALGYRPAEFEAVIPTLDPATPVADLVKQALAALRRR